MYQRYLIKFMREKDTRLREHGVTTVYFRFSDSNFILKWSDKKAERVWFVLKENIKTRTAGLGVFTCPFCLDILTDSNKIKKYFFRKKRKCIGCKYKKYHKCCFEKNSDYQKITEEASNIQSILSNQFYRNLIEKIERIKL